MRAIRKYFFPLLLSLTIFLSTGISTYAMGDGNIDGGGGSFGTGSELNVWRNNQDGVRVTVVTTGGSVVATPIDLSNCNISSTVLNFGKVSKLQYTAGSSLSINASYTYSKPAVALPRIISGSVNKASIAAIKRYICSEYAAQFIASKTGIPFENLINDRTHCLLHAQWKKLCHDSNGGCPLQQVIRRCIKKGASLPDAPEPATRVVFRKI